MIETVPTKPKAVIQEIPVRQIQVMNPHQARHPILWTVVPALPEIRSTLAMEALPQVAISGLPCFRCGLRV